MIANALTASRILLLLPLFVLIGGGTEARWWALGAFLLAGATDVLD